MWWWCSVADCHAVSLLQFGITALMYAAYSGHSAVVGLLLDAKADTDVPDKVLVRSCPWYHCNTRNLYQLTHRPYSLCRTI